jgi:hypothetical protein
VQIRFQAHGSEQEKGRRVVFSEWTRSLPRLGRILFLKERTWNVYENKGPAQQAGERTWNLYENKGLIRLMRECC